MLGTLKTILLGERAYAESAANPEERQQLALAALLVEMARADLDETAEERAAISSFLAGHFALTDAEAQSLLVRAEQAMEESVCLFDFTRALHDSLDYEQKLEVVRLLWRTALADGRLDKYEEYLIRKVADLLYVSHSDIIRLRNEEREAEQ